MLKTLAVVVTYNRKKLLEECLFSLKNQTEKELDILVVDNASTDGTRDYLEAINDEKISCVFLSENTGGAGGFSAGIREGVLRGYENLWLMDDDTVPQTDALEELLKADKNLNGKYGFLSSLALFTDGSPCVMNNHLLPSKITSDSVRAVGGEIYFEVLTATFVSLFIKSGIVKQYGLPIKEMFIWSDDTEYTSRITKGDKGYFVPQSKVLHKMEKNQSPALESPSPDRLERMTLNIRNRYYIARRDGFKKKMRFYARHAILFFRVLFKAKDKKFKRIAVIFKGIFKGWAFRPKTEYVDKI